MNLIFLFTFLVAVAPAIHVPRTDDDVERDFIPECARLATGEFEARHKGIRYSWPVSVRSIGHTMASYQNYGGSMSGAYFHHGLDIRADAGSDVIASRGGKVVNIENYEIGQPEYWEIAILDDEGFLWQYHHVDHDEIPQSIFRAYEQGTKIADGTKIGTVVYWPVSSFGEQYHHVHLNILGKNREYLNGFAFLEPLEDNQGPQISEIALLKDGKKVSGTQISGNYSLMMNASDLVLHSKFIVPPNRIQMSVDASSPVTVWEFNKLPGGSSNTARVNDFYVPGLVCGDYTCRRPIMNLGFSLTDAPVFPAAKGPHQISVTVSDFQGNQATRDFRWTVN